MERLMATSVVTEAHMIKPYVGPAYLVELVGDACSEDDISSINEEWGFDIIDTYIMRWGYEAIIQVRIPGEPQFYLANLGIKG
jgi:hypothetical protein